MAIEASQLLKLIGIEPNTVHAMTQITEGLSQQCFRIELKPLSVTEKSQHLIAKVFEHFDGFNKEKHVLNALSRTNLSAKLIKQASFDQHHILLMEQLPGETLSNSPLAIDDKIQLTCQLMANFHLQLTESLLHGTRDLHTPVHSLNFNDIFTSLVSTAQLATHSEREISAFIKHCLSNLEKLNGTDKKNTMICHGDLNFSNVIVEHKSARVIDFEAISLMPIEYDIAMMLAVNELPCSYITHACVSYSNAANDNLPVNALNQQLVEAFYPIALLINGLWYLSEHHKRLNNDQYLKKAQIQFKSIVALTDLTLL